MLISNQHISGLSKINIFFKIIFNYQDPSTSPNMNSVYQ